LKFRPQLIPHNQLVWVTTGGFQQNRFGARRRFSVL
jgi:hypothetical protein